MTDELGAHGVRIAVPRGWEAELSTLDDRPAEGGFGFSSASGRVLVHLANFGLPAVRVDYGSGAVEIMDRGGILMVLMEFEGSSAASALFSEEGIPTRLDAADFSADALQRRLPGQAGTQRFFRVGSRPFVLYVVLGSAAGANLLVPEVNRMLRVLSID